MEWVFAGGAIIAAMGTICGGFYFVVIRAPEPVETILRQAWSLLYPIGAFCAGAIGYAMATREGYGTAAHIAASGLFTLAFLVRLALGFAKFIKREPQ